MWRGECGRMGGWVWKGECGRMGRWVWKGEWGGWEGGCFV